MKQFLSVQNPNGNNTNKYLNERKKNTQIVNINMNSLNSCNYKRNNETRDLLALIDR